MGNKTLDNTNMMHTWTSYTGSVCGILNSSGIFEIEPYLFSGMTGLAFHFIIREDICLSGPTVYDWGSEHFEMMDRIGVHSKLICVYNMNLNTYELIRKDAVDFIKESIDRGVGLVIWAPTILEFGIIVGYDDEDGVVFAKDCLTGQAEPILYENLGVSEVPYLFLQTFYAKVDVNNDKIFIESLKYAVQQWEKQFHVPPYYASGRKAYELLISALENGKYDKSGLTYNLSVYSESKMFISKYLDYIINTSDKFNYLKEAYDNFKSVAEHFSKASELLPFAIPSNSTDSFKTENVLLALEEIKNAFKQEEEAMKIISDNISK